MSVSFGITSGGSERKELCKLFTIFIHRKTIDCIAIFSKIVYYNGKLCSKNNFQPFIFMTYFKIAKYRDTFKM